MVANCKCDPRWTTPSTPPSTPSQPPLSPLQPPPQSKAKHELSHVCHLSREESRSKFRPSPDRPALSPCQLQVAEAVLSGVCLVFLLFCGGGGGGGGMRGGKCLCGDSSLRSLASSLQGGRGSRLNPRQSKPRPPLYTSRPPPPRPPPNNGCPERVGKVLVRRAVRRAMKGHCKQRIQPQGQNWEGQQKKKPWTQKRLIPRCIFGGFIGVFVRAVYGG